MPGDGPGSSSVPGTTLARSSRPRLRHLSRFSLSFTRCSTVSTLNVRSSRAARKKSAVRNRQQGTPAPPVSSWTLMHCEHPVPARCPRVQAPTHAQPTNSTNKGGRGCGVTWVGLDGAEVCSSRQGPGSAPSPSPGRSRPACKSHPNQVFSLRGQKGTCVLPPLQAVSRGRKWVLILQAHHQSLPLILTQVPV